MTSSNTPYPPIADYALISDCHCTALISLQGSIDWCCMPRVDSDSCFGRLLDWQRGGHCAITPGDGALRTTGTTRRYLPGTMILETRFETATGQVKLIDFFAMDAAAEEQARYDLVRIVEGISGHVPMQMVLCARFDYGEIIPEIRQRADGFYTAIGGSTGLVIRCDMPLELGKHRDLEAAFTLEAGQSYRLSMHFQEPEQIDGAPPDAKLNLAADIEEGFSRTLNWWEQWSARMHETQRSTLAEPTQVQAGGQLTPAPEQDEHPEHANLSEMPDPQTLRSAVILKALTHEHTGAIVAAPTTSLPEWIGAGRNWDYRFCWVRDSVFTVRALYELGYRSEGERFLQFIRRAAAGSAEQLQIMYGVDGKRRLTEVELSSLEGYRQSKPVRIGNFAAKQSQLDIYGEIMEIAVLWEASGHPIDEHYWDFLTDVVNTVCHRWQEQDFGIWEFRVGPTHHVHSKAMCWGALTHGIALAKKNGFPAPLEQWESNRDSIRHAVESDGYDDKRGVFVQAFENRHLDAALLLLPRIGFVAYDDPRMLRTTEAICAELDDGGLLTRYNAPDGLPGREGVFLPCTFWLVSCLAQQGRVAEAKAYYERALRCANDLGLFSEEFDPASQQMLGNFPQGLTHVSQIMAALALKRASAKGEGSN